MGPLSGLRVVELAGIGPGPFAAMLLADLGADVIRVDRAQPGLEVLAPETDVVNRGRPSVVVDLKSPQGRELILELCERADVLLEGFRPGVAERLGVGPDDCLSRNPRLTYGRMTGWGQDGPLAHTAAHDINYISASGLLSLIGRSDGPPQIPLNVLGDLAGGALYLVIGVLSSVFEARTSGRGQVVDAAIVDGTAHLTAWVSGMIAAGQWREERGVNLIDSGAPHYDVYETADSKWMSLGALEDKFWDQASTLLGLVDVPDRHDATSWPELRRAIAAAFATRTQAEWTAVFDGSDACVAAVQSPSQAWEHPHLRARQTFVEHHGTVQPAPAPRFSRTPATLSTPPQHTGANTLEALRAWGVGGLDELAESGAITQIDD